MTDEPTGILRRTYRIERWARWDDELHSFACDFHACFGVYPNLAQASEISFRRIDIAARKENILSDEGEPADEGYTPLSEFVADAYVLTFVLDPRLGDGVVVLLFDSDPDGGGEVPEEDTEVAARSHAAGAPGSATRRTDRGLPPVGVEEHRPVTRAVGARRASIFVGMLVPVRFRARAAVIALAICAGCGGSNARRSAAVEATRARPCSLEWPRNPTDTRVGIYVFERATREPYSPDDVPGYYEGFYRFDGDTVTLRWATAYVHRPECTHGSPEDVPHMSLVQRG